MDIVFGKRMTAEERSVAEACAPPRSFRAAFHVLQISSLLCTLILILSKWGWLPLVDPQIGSDWFWTAFGVNLVIRLGWEQITGLYKRRAAAREALKAASPE